MQQKQTQLLFTYVRNLVSSPEEARMLIAHLQTVDVDAEWAKAQVPYVRACVMCQRSYLVTRTNAPQEGFCPFCDSDLHRTELMRVQKQNRRAVRAKQPATLTFPQWMRVLKDFNGKCAYCQQFKFTDMEHFVPLKKGGGTVYGNVVPSCSYCNWRKRSRNPNKSKNMRLNPEAVERVRAYLRGQAS